MMASRLEMKTELQAITKERDELRKKINSKREKERALIDICRQEKPVYEVNLLFILQ